MDHTENFTDMSTFNRVKKYRKPLVEIDKKIKSLEEGMTTSGFYTIVQQSDGVNYQPPVNSPAPPGDLGACIDGHDFDLEDWAAQGDGSTINHNLSQLMITDADGRSINRFPVMPPTGSTEENGDYPEGANPIAMVINPRAFTGRDLGYLNSNGFNFVRRISNVFGVAYTPFTRAFEQYYADNTWRECTIYLWSPIDCLFGQCYGAVQYYPSHLSNTSTPKAERALYSYQLLIPTNFGPGNPDYRSTATVNAEPPRVTNVVSRTELGPPVTYTKPGPTLPPPIKTLIDFGMGIVNFVSGFGSGESGGDDGGGAPPPPPPPPPPPEDQPGDDTPPPPPPEDGEGGGGPPTETDDDDRPLVPLGYDENGKPTGFTRLNPTQMEQFKDGGGDEAIREGKSMSEVMMQGYENRKNAFTDFTSGISDGMTVLSQVQDTLQLNQALGNIEPSSDGGRATIKEGEKGSSTNPIQTNLSDSSMNALQDAVNNYDPRVDGDLTTYLNQFTSTSDNLGLKATHNNIQGYEVRGDDLILKDRYGFGPSQDIKDSPIPFTKNPITGESNTVGQLADTAEVIVNALGFDGKSASEQVQTIFDQLGPVGELAGRVASGGERGLPGKDDPVVHFETVIPGGAKNLGSNFQTTNQPVREETLFEKWKKKNQKKPESKPDQLKLIHNYFYYLPKMVKKMIIMDFEIEVQIMMLSPEEKILKEKELRNTLINKNHELYMDEKFPENVKQTSRVKKILARNIEMTDPKRFKDPKPALTYGKVFGDDPKNKRVRKSDPNKKSASRFFRKPKPKTKDQVREERLEELRQLENKFSNK